MNNQRASVAYLDASIILNRVLGQQHEQIDIQKFKNIYTSNLSPVEVHRNIDRLRIEYSWSDKEVAMRVQLFLEESLCMHEIPLQSLILKRASLPFPTIVKTLDALHIATALFLQQQIDENLIFLTHDIKQGRSARACGLHVNGLDES